jgi:hypothetical protein
VALGAVAGSLAMILCLVVEVADKNEQPRAASRIIAVAGGLLGLAGSILLMTIWCPNCTSLRCDYGCNRPSVPISGPRVSRSRRRS